MVDTNYIQTGQDWTRDDFSEAEYAALTDWYAKVHGFGNLNLVQFVPFMLGLRPDALKRYRHWVEEVPSGRALSSPIGPSTALIWVHYYLISGYADGLLYEIIAARDRGASRETVAQTLAIAWLHGGPAGMNSAAKVAQEYMAEWPAGEVETLEYPPEWAADSGAFASGLDLAKAGPLDEAERVTLRTWYERVEGEVPEYLEVLATYHPSALRLHRARYEGVMRGPLPKELIACFHIHAAMLLNQEAGLRRSVRMARVFGVKRDQVIQVLTTPQVYLGELGMDRVASVTAELETWPA